MSNRLTKTQLRAALKTSDAGLAEFFGITRAAVAQWPDDQPIPELRQLQVENRRPDILQLLAEAEDNDPHRRGAAEGEFAAQADAVPAPVSEAA